MWNLTIDTSPEVQYINPRLTLPGGVRLDDVAALATTDEQPFLLMPSRIVRFRRTGVRVLGVRL